MKKLLITGILLAAVIGFLSWWYSPKQVVKRRTDSLLRTLTLNQDQSVAAKQMGVYSINALLAPEVEFASGEIEQANGTFARSDVESTYGWLCEHAKEMTFTRKKTESITINGDTGRITFVVDAKVVVMDSEIASGLYRTTFEWVQNDAWQLRSAKWSKVED